MFTHSESALLVLQEFEIVMVKQQGSLGFTLRKEDDSVLGHYVRALVRDPAVSEGREGRIKPGDKIVAVSILFSVYSSVRLSVLMYAFVAF